MLIKNCVFKIFSRLLDYQCLHYATFPPVVSVFVRRDAPAEGRSVTSRSEQSSEKSELFKKKNTMFNELLVFFRVLQI